MLTAIIPARKGSKSIIGKNMIELGRQPLIYWTMHAAEMSKEINEIILTTDCEEIANYCLDHFNVNIIFRDEKLSDDHAKTSDVLLDVLNKHNVVNSHIILLQVTSPFRTISDISRGYEIFCKKTINTCVSVKRCPISPELLIKKTTCNLGKKSEFFKDKRRQDMEEYYLINGAIYIFSKDSLLYNNSIFSQELSFIEMTYNNSLDIDDKNDLEIAREQWNQNAT